MDMVIQFRGTIYEKGYGQVAQLVMRDKTLKPTAKAIYAYLCSFAWGRVEGERSAFPSIKMQCEELGINRDTYYKYRKTLEDKGYITIEAVHGNSGKFNNNIYYIENVPCPKTSDTDKHIENKGISPCPKSSDTEKPDTVNWDTKKKRSLRKELKKDIYIDSEHAEKKEFQFYDWVNNK
jgi:DNA-binding transcriptional MocR family regulator